MSQPKDSRIDFGLLAEWVKPNSRVLDLGCGDGTLLQLLKDEKNIQGYGLEIDPHEIQACIEKQVNVIEQDIDSGLDNFATNSFDIVVMTQALQVLKRPDVILDEMLRVGQECIVTFPNFGNWQARLYLTLRGRMPVTEQLDYQWYDTPNIHFCTVNDFEALCHDKGISILDRRIIATQAPNSMLASINPNLFGEVAVYRLK